MNIGNVNPYQGTNFNHAAKQTGGNTKSREEMINDFYSGISSAAELSTTKGVGEPIGLTTVKFGNTNQHYGMVATYSEASTEEDPIIRVTSNYGGESVTYDVHVNQVDPRNASQLEIFALTSYTDDQGITERGTFGTYTKMKCFGLNAEDSGYVSGLSDSSNFMSQKYNWIDMMLSMMKDYFANPVTYSQGLDCQKIVAGLQGWCEKFDS